MASTTCNLLLLLLLHLAAVLHPVCATEFIFNSFNTSSDLLLYGNATVQSSALILTTDTAFSIGRALYPHQIPTNAPNSSVPLYFSTSFIFSISTYPGRLAGHGFAFIFVPSTGISGTSSAQNLGLFNLTNNGDPNNHIFAVKFDVFENQEFNDYRYGHIGVNINSLTSTVKRTAGYWEQDNENNPSDYDSTSEFHQLTLNDGENYQVWIDYIDSRINVTIAPAGMKKPHRPLISYPIDILDVVLNQTYVGFTAANGALVQSNRILAWSFSNSNFSIANALITEHFISSDGSLFTSMGFIVGISVGCAVLILCGAVMVYVFLLRKKRREDKNVKEDWEMDYWPHRMDYQKIYSATKYFSDENVVGVGGNGKVYKGLLTRGVQVAVKRISLENERMIEQFLAEISSLGRLKHRNLVGLRGWCKTRERTLLIIYDFMENGSLDKWLFNSRSSVMLSWAQRIKVLKDVAAGILYLHDGWQFRVLHRDIKSSNVLLDKDMNARLADFGLARMHQHGQLARTTSVVGTIGYMAPELVHKGRPSSQTDVYSFGVLVLEVVCGRKPVEQGEKGLVEWVHGLMEGGELMSALDERLSEITGFEAGKVLGLGLRCTDPDPGQRPSMRAILEELDRIDGTESDDMKPQGSRWSHYHQSFGVGHPMYEDFQRGLISSSAVSLATSDLIIEGR